MRVYKLPGVDEFELIESRVNIKIRELERLASEIRGRVIEMSHQSREAHLGSSLSCIDIVTAAYWGVLDIDPRDPLGPGRDRFILSKGHAAAALFAVLAFRGFFPKEMLDTFGKEGSRLQEHLGPYCVPGVEVATGSLGHGLSFGLGMALAGRLQKRTYRVFVVMGDGECNEGSVWEAAMMAAAQKLGQVTVVIDYNKWQATGRSDEILALSPLRDKWASFGWEAVETDGHDINELVRLMGERPRCRPRAIIAHTIKGKGVSFMEDDNNWHYRIPTAEEVEMAHVELGLK